MSERKTPLQGDAPPEAEPFLERWARRKAQARAGNEDAFPQPAAEPAPEPQDPQAGDQGPLPLPDLASLGADSDYSAFMAPGVDAGLRRQALRKLFSSPQFNVRDGLDDYCDDFTQWNKLGDIVTADMRYQIERAARLAEQALAKDGDSPSPAGDPGTAPVVADATGRIVWVVGHAVDADVAPSGGDDDVIVLTFDQPAPSGSEGS